MFRTAAPMSARRPSLVVAAMASLALLLLSVSVAPAVAHNVPVSLILNQGPVSTQLMEGALVAYAVERPDLTIDAAVAKHGEMIRGLYGSPPTIDMFVAGRVPGVPVAPALTSVINANDDIVSFPIVASAVVPIYNLPTLDRSVPLLLSRPVMARILMGHITRWNDSEIAALNPALRLPEEGITMVVHGDNNGQTLSLAQACTKFHPDWAAEMGPISDLPPWPLAKYHAHITVREITGPTSVVGATPYTFGWATISTAVALNVSMAAMVNKAGQVVVASTQTINYAFVELGVHTDPLTGKTEWVQDLSDGAGLEAWPMTFGFGVWLPASYSRTTCLARGELVKFWSWFLGSPVVASVASSLQMAVLPPLLYTALNMASFFRNTIQCEGTMLAGETSAFITVAGVSLTSIYSDLVSLFLGYFGATDAQYSYEFDAIPELRAVQQVAARELDTAFIVMDQFREMHPEVLETQLRGSPEGGELITLPFALYAVVPIFNLPPGVAEKFEGQWPLNLSPLTLGQVFNGMVTSWTDPLMESVNPGITAAFLAAGANPNITLVTCCKVAGTATPVGNALVQALRDASPEFSAHKTWTLPVDWSSVHTILSRKGVPGVQVSAEQQMEAAVLRIPGAIGYKLVYSDTPTLQHEFGLVRGTINTTDGEVSTLLPTPSALAHCAKSKPVSIGAEYKLFSIMPEESNTATVRFCWPITILASMVSHGHYSGAAQCTRGNHTLQMLQWMLTADTLESSSTARGILRMSQVAGMTALHTTALNAVECDGETMLITLPVVWEMHTGVTVFAAVLQFFSLALVLISACILWTYRHRTVLRSSSVPFQFVILVGLAIMFTSLMNFASPPTDSLCQALVWQINVGFSLMYAPLLLKMWRIYKIFDRRVLKVVKISNERLGAIVAALVGVDVVINLVWQLYSPVYAAPNMVLENGRTHSYMQCTGDSEALPFLVAIGVLKGALLLFGSYMGFTTRNVASTFNESKNVAWAIYNVFFSVAIIVPILFFSNARGDAFTILVVFLLFWVSFATFALNFGSKFLLLFKGEDGAGQNLDGASVDGGEKDMGGASAALFSFPSLVDLPKNVLDRYIGALEAQMKSAKQRHTMLLNDLGGGGGGGAGGAGGAGHGHANSAIKANTSGMGGGGRHHRSGNHSGHYSGNHSGLHQRHVAGRDKETVSTGGGAEAYRVRAPSTDRDEHSYAPEANTKQQQGAWTNLVQTKGAPGSPSGGGGGGGVRTPLSPSPKTGGVGAGAGHTAKLSSRAAQGLHRSNDMGDVEMAPIAESEAAAAAAAAAGDVAALPVRVHMPSDEASESPSAVGAATPAAAGESSAAAAGAGAGTTPAASIPWMDSIDGDQTTGAEGAQSSSKSAHAEDNQ